MSDTKSEPLASAPSLKFALDLVEQCENLQHGFTPWQVERIGEARDGSITQRACSRIIDDLREVLNQRRQAAMVGKAPSPSQVTGLMARANYAASLGRVNLAAKATALAEDLDADRAKVSNAIARMDALLGLDRMEREERSAILYPSGDEPAEDDDIDVDEDPFA